MPENETASTDAVEASGAPAEAPPNTEDLQLSTEDLPPSTEEAPPSTEDITYHAVEKDGQVTAIWEMQGRKHLRTIDPRSRMGLEILRLYTSDHTEEEAATQ